MIDEDHHAPAKIQSVSNSSAFYPELARGRRVGDRGAMILVPYESGIPGRVITDLLTYHGIESWGFDISFEEMIFFVRPNDHQEAITLLVQNEITYHQEMLNVNRSLVLGIVGGTIFLLGALIIGLSLSLALLG